MGSYVVINKRLIYDLKQRLYREEKRGAMPD